MSLHTPEFKGPIEGYVVNFLKKNFWRIANTHEYEEALQEAHVVFLRCASRYTMIEEPQHFMALFKTAWTNQFNDLSNRATDVRATQVQRGAEDEDADAGLDVVGELENAGQLAVMIKQAPKEVLMVLNLFLNAPSELLELAAATWRAQGRYRADGDKAVCRMLGLPEESRPVTKTVEYFGGSGAPPV